MKRYRFNTKEELIKRWGTDWRSCSLLFGFSFVPEMDYLLGNEVGQYLSDRGKELIKIGGLPFVFRVVLDNDGERTNWYVCKRFITEINDVPSYEPITLIRD